MTVGLAAFDFYPEHQDLYATFLEVAESSRGEGLGRVLLEGVFEHANELAQEMDEQLYLTGQGFTNKGKRSLLPALKELDTQYSHVNFEEPN